MAEEEEVVEVIRCGKMEGRPRGRENLLEGVRRRRRGKDGDWTSIAVDSFMCILSWFVTVANSLTPLQDSCIVTITGHMLWICMAQDSPS